MMGEYINMIISVKRFQYMCSAQRDITQDVPSSTKNP